MGALLWQREIQVSRDLLLDGGYTLDELFASFVRCPISSIVFCRVVPCSRDGMIGFVVYFR